MSGGPEETTGPEFELRLRLDRLIAAWTGRSDELDVRKGRAFRIVLRRKLYKPLTWNDYCRAAHGITGRHARRLVDQAVLAEWDPRVPLPVSGRQVRALASLSWEQRHRVARRIDRENRDGGFAEVSSDRVEEVAREVAGRGQVVRRAQGGLVVVKGGVITLRASNILEWIEAMAIAARQIDRKGVHALTSALDNLGAEQAEDYMAKLVHVYLVANRGAAHLRDKWGGFAPHSGEEPLTAEPRKPPEPPGPRGLPGRAAALPQGAASP